MRKAKIVCNHEKCYKYTHYISFSILPVCMADKCEKNVNLLIFLPTKTSEKSLTYILHIYTYTTSHWKKGFPFEDIIGHFESVI